MKALKIIAILASIAIITSAVVDTAKADVYIQAFGDGKPKPPATKNTEDMSRISKK
jgi:hypothetical protein